jgi:hypothetical protein
MSASQNNSVPREILCHQNQVVVAASLLQSVLLHAVPQEAQSRVKTPRLFIVHAELDQLNPLTGVIAYRFDQPSTDLGIPCGGSNVHSPKRAFVSFFLAQLGSKADNADELCVAERAEHCRAAEPIREQTQRLSIFNLEGATERFREPPVECLDRGLRPPVRDDVSQCRRRSSFVFTSRQGVFLVSCTR